MLQKIRTQNIKNTQLQKLTKNMSTNCQKVPQTTHDHKKLVGAFFPITSLTFSSKIFYSLPLPSFEPRQLYLECQREGECPAQFTPKCRLSSYVGTVKNEEMVGKKIDKLILMSKKRNVTISVKFVFCFF